VRARADALIARMMPEEKTGQLVDLFMIIPTLSKVNEAGVAAGTVGSVLFVADPTEINRLQHIAVNQ
jgi:beta-glucosidase